MRRVLRSRPRLMVDSGAYTAWTKGIDIPLAEYIEFLKEREALIDTYFNLDVIPGRKGTKRSFAEVERAAQESHDNLLKMRKEGLNPIPVFHQGERFEWLHKFLADGCDYIALGGLGGQSIDNSVVWLDKCWSILTDSDGLPIVKVHGLGVGSFEMVQRYPWYSCDSTTWAQTAAYGSIFVPRYVDGKPDYNKLPIKMTISAGRQKEVAPDVEQSEVFFGDGGKPFPSDHFRRRGPLEIERVRDFINNHVCIPLKDVETSYIARARVIVYFMQKFEKACTANITRFRYRHGTLV